MMTDRNVTVIGAGIAGLAVAVAMARRGANVRVLERSSEMTRVGAGLQISPNGFAVIRALGLDASLRSAGLESRAIELRDYRAGRRVMRIDLTQRRNGFPFMLIHRAHLAALLEKEARGAGVDIALGTSIDPERVDGSLVIGADGIGSATRRYLNGPEVPLYTGQVAWRAVIAGNAEPEAHVWMGPGRHLVTYALRSRLRNMVAVEERARWVGEDWDRKDDSANLRAAFAGFAPEVRRWLARVDDVRLWGLFRHEVAAHWHDGRFALVGDAAHPTLPFLAQGANLALEDAWVLARCLDRFPQCQALAEYQGLRRGRAARAVAAATANSRNFHLRDPVLRGFAHNLLRIGGVIRPNMALKRLEWLYGFDVTSE